MSIKKTKNSWKFLKKVSGKTKVYLPSNFDELLLIVVTNNIDNFSKLSINVPRILFEIEEETHKFKVGSYATSSYNCECVIEVSKEYVNILNFYINGTVDITNVGLKVFYK